MLRMREVHVLRHKVLIEGKSQRAVAREMGLSRNTVRRYMERPEPVARRRARNPPAERRERAPAQPSGAGASAATPRRAPDRVV